MSLCRVGIASRFVSPQLASRSVLTNLASASVFRRYFWWSRKSNEEDKGQKEDKKKDDKEKKKPEVPSFGTKDQIKPTKDSERIRSVIRSYLKTWRSIAIRYFGMTLQGV